MTTEEDRDMAVLARAVAQLSEHFDTVQIIATRHDPKNDCTIVARKGVGNWHARFGSVREWLVREERRIATEVDAEDEAGGL